LQGALGGLYVGPSFVVFQISFDIFKGKKAVFETNKKGTQSGFLPRLGAQEGTAKNNSLFYGKKYQDFFNVTPKTSSAFLILFNPI